MASLIPSNIVLPDVSVQDIDFLDIEQLSKLSDFTIDKPKSCKQINKSDVTICLNMIVRNESKIITRLLESVLSIIDTYIICDTGSTDNTPSIIKDFFDSKDIPGEVIYEPFKNFGYNRTFALKAAYGKATYALLLDADMIFKIEPTFNKELLSAESYLIIQKGSGLTYYNTRLIRLDINSKCIGPTHEYYDLPPGSKNEKIDSIWIDDIGDGGSKANKFERDIKLLKDGIVEEPNNGRYYFYLANSYFNTGNHEESIQYYKKRIELGGWFEEIFYSYLNLGHAYMTTKQTEMAIFAWMEGYNHHPARSETIYEICKYYREKGKNKIAMTFCILGKSIPYPKNDSLFIHNDVYETGFDYELSILGYYNNYPNINKVICRLMNKEKQNYNNMLSNYKFYCPKLSSSPYLINKIGGKVITDNINVCGTTYQMNASNPCIFKINKNNHNTDSNTDSNNDINNDVNKGARDRILEIPCAKGGARDRILEIPCVKRARGASALAINVRFVNYLLNRNGTYHFAVDDGKIVTVNKIYNLDKDFNMIGEPIVLIPENNNLRYVGMEDLKPYSISNGNGNGNGNTNNIAFVGTCQSPISGNISIGYGEMNLSTDSKLNYNVVKTSYNKGCEKNWVFFNSSNDDLQIIYQWYPLTIGKLAKTNNKQNEIVSLDIKTTKNMPPYFRNTRGSSNGCEYNGEIWFLCHVVEYCQPREYYHFFSIFDKQTMDIKRWSNLFKFEGEKIEYALGMIVEESRIIISYSKWDSEPTIGIYNKEKVESELF